MGWVIAKIIAALVGKLLHWLRLDERIGKAAGENKVPRLENIITKAVYYLILLFAVVAALNALGLTIVTQPLNAMLNAIFAYIPSLIAGGALAGLGGAFLVLEAADATHELCARIVGAP